MNECMASFPFHIVRKWRPNGSGLCQTNPHNIYNNIHDHEYDYKTHYVLYNNDWRVAVVSPEKIRAAVKRIIILTQ